MRTCRVCGIEISGQGKYCPEHRKIGQRITMKSHPRRCERGEMVYHGEVVPACEETFVPNSNSQKYHNEECGEMAKWWARKGRIEAQREQEKAMKLSQININGIMGNPSLIPLRPLEETNFSAGMIFDIKEGKK